MSHLTARPPPLRRPLAPEARMPNLPSPPETDSADSAFQNNSVPSVVGVKPELEASQASQPRRTSTLSYHTSLLDGRAERTSARASKWLVAVVPSDTLSSHMSATGHRVSQGTLMPLFPTFYAQCTALAREFGFPSVVGLAIFIHITTQGITMTPRVSEETWQILWSHLFDARSPSSYVPFAQLPVGGRIEIDVDMQKARWFESWVHSRRRTSVPPVSAAPSVSHWRGDSRTTFPEEHADDRSESLAPPRRRHVPRQLSLLDKIETASIASSGNQNGLRAAPEVEVEHEHDLSTAIPEVTTAAIPTAGSELASRVKSWRASSSVAPSPMAATRQVSLDPVHMPNGIDLPSPPMQENDEEIRLEDFQWSVSSEGPGDYDYGSIYSPGEWSGVPSVHLDRRLEGSIMLSPTSIATSWGPVHDDDYVDSPHDWENGSSVDLTRRLEHSVPPSPSVATSWGPDDHEHHEHHEHKHHPAVSHRRNRSLHLADRGVEDSPKTPTTATSWGPGSYADDEEFFSLPQSPSTPHIADRCRDEECDLPQLRGLASVWPALAPSSGPSSVAGVSFPYFQPRGNDLRSQVNFSRPRETTSRSAFPYFEPQAPVSHFVWPFFTPEDGLSRFAFPYVQAPETESRSGFPYVQPQDAPSTWNFPYLKTESAVSRSAFPHLKFQDTVSSTVWPYHQVLPSVEINLVRQYPSVAPYGLVYPFFEIYPGVVSYGEMNDPMRPVEILLKPMSYPFFQVYPDAKPQAPAPEVLGMLVSKSSMGAHQNFYTEPEESPGAVVSQSFAAYFKEAELAARPSTVLPAQYPYFSLYPAVYPMFEIYPGHVSDGELDDVWRPIEILLKSMTYPVFEIYPDVTTKAAPAAPEILGMLVSKSSMGAHMNFYTEPEESPGAVVSQSFAEYFKSMEQPSMVLPALYPNFSIYPAQYPYFEIYPGVICNGDLEEQSVVPLSPSSYPIFQIYQGHFSTGEVEDSQFPPEESPGVLMSQGFAEYFKSIELSNRPSTVLQAQYPFFSIYPAQYPIFEIYPGNFSDGELDDVWRPIEILLKPMRYPVFEIYPDATSKSEAPAVDSLGVLVSKSSMGAHMNYYSDPEESPGAIVSNSFAAYFKEAELAARPSTVLPALYPTFSIYPAVYPIFEIYPGNLSDGELDYVWRPIEILLKPMSYPFFEIYPKVSVDSQPVVESLGMLVSKSSMGAHMNFYTAPEESPGFVVSKTFAEFFKGVVVDLRSPSDPQALYPVLSIYPAQYPFFEIYPGNVCDGEVEEVAMDPKTATADALGMLVSKSSMGAHLNFYSAQEESPGLLMSKSFAAHLDYGPQVDEVIVTLGAVYPHFNLYPAQYPVFDIYPSGLQTASPAKRHVPMGLRIKKTHAMLHSEVFGFPVRRMHRSHAQLHDEVASALRPASPEYASILRAHENRRTSAVRRSSNASESSPSGGLSTQATAVNKSGTLSPRRTGSAESMSGRSPRGFVTGHRRTESSPSVESTSFAKDPRPTHRRTQSAENAENAGNQAGRRRDPPPVALRAPIAANRQSHTSHAPPPPAEETSHFEPEDDVPEELLPPQRRRLPEHATSKNGLPSNPTVNRIHAPPPAVPQSQYPHNLSPVQERPPAALQRSISPKNAPSQSRTTLSRAASIDGVPHAPRRRMRDSLVSERAKMFDSGSSAAAPVSEPRRSLDETPKSKAPPVPPLPPSRSFSASVSRIVHKLDRSKFPFS